MLFSSFFLKKLFTDLRNITQACALGGRLITHSQSLLITFIYIMNAGNLYQPFMLFSLVWIFYFIFIFFWIYLRYVILKKFQSLFERIYAQTIIWDGAVMNGGILFTNMSTAITKKITISIVLLLFSSSPSLSCLWLA